MGRAAVHNGHGEAVMNSFAINDTVRVGGDAPLLVIAGPCIIEAPEICLEIGLVLQEICAELGLGYVFKASYDKANRTSGESFRGAGVAEGLAILADIKARLGVPVLTDVHECAQIHDAAEVADILQIPAFLCRQTDLLLAAGHNGRVVNVKKGQFLAPEDMKHALAKVASTGNHRVMSCERGTTFGYHNLVVDMRGLVTMRELGSPVVFDATHSVQQPGGLGNASGGRREFVPPLLRAALAVGVDAIFLETHPDPSKALSDGPNSVPLAEMAALLRQGKAIHELVRAR